MSGSDSARLPSRGEHRALWILGVIVLIAFSVVAASVIARQRRTADRSEALRKMRSLGMMLLEFDSEYGSFPDDATASRIPEEARKGYQLTGDHSNDYFRQLIVVGLKSEKPFWCKTALSPRPPDDDYTPSKALEAGEVGFSYIMYSRGQGHSSSGDPGWVVVAAASDGDRADWTFDMKSFGGAALVLKVDGSVAAMGIDPATKFISTGVKGRYIQTIGDGHPSGYDPAIVAPLPAITQR